MQNRRRSLFFQTVDLGEMVMCLEDLINYFAQPEDEMGKNTRKMKTAAAVAAVEFFFTRWLLNYLWVDELYGDYLWVQYIEHEERQNRLRALRNRQDLFQEEGILNLILDAIDNINTITSQGYLVTLAGEESGTQNFDVITSYLYQLLGIQQNPQMHKH